MSYGLSIFFPTWPKVEKKAMSHDPDKREISFVQGTKLLEERLTKLGILGGEISGLGAAVREAERRLDLDATIVNTGLEAIGGRSAY